MIKTLDQSQIDVERSLPSSRRHQPSSAGERQSWAQVVLRIEYSAKLVAAWDAAWRRNGTPVWLVGGGQGWSLRVPQISSPANKARISGLPIAPCSSVPPPSTKGLHRVYRALPGEEIGKSRRHVEQ